MADQEKLVGTVVLVRLNKGFAFIRGKEDGLARFMHAGDVKPRSAFDRLYEGQEVRFIPVDLSKTLEPTNIKGNGLRAIEVEVV